MPMQPTIGPLPVSEATELLDRLGDVNARWYRRRARSGLKPPRLLESHVRYAREQPRSDHWVPASVVYQRGYGDCEDLTAAYIGEMRAQGMRAWPVALRQGPKDWHYVVGHPGGRVTDPSALLRQPQVKAFRYRPGGQIHAMLRLPGMQPFELSAPNLRALCQRVYETVKYVLLGTMRRGPWTETNKSMGTVRGR